MRTQSGLYVYRDAHDTPMLLAYRKVSLQYLALLVTGRGMYISMVHFSHILDTVPIRAIFLHTDLPFYESLKHTVQGWISNIRQCLLERL